jgi:hypothetical protein
VRGAANPARCASLAFGPSFAFGETRSGLRVSPHSDAIREFRLGWAPWTAHDGSVTALLVILLAGALLAMLTSRQGAARPASGSARAGVARKSLSPYWFLGAILIGALLLRFGVNWLVVGVGMLLALVRGLLPLLRFLPFLQNLRQGSAPGGAGGGSDGRSSVRRPQRMSRQEALQVFGLAENATREDVQREYRRLMRQVHPDLGGSSYLAAKINEAKDVLS